MGDEKNSKNSQTGSLRHSGTDLGEPENVAQVKVSDKTPELPAIKAGDIEDVDVESTSEALGLGKFSNIRDQTASRLAYVILAIFGGSFLVHYWSIYLLSGPPDKEALKVISEAWSSWLPAMSGIVGAAVTYYFTDKGKS